MRMQHDFLVDWQSRLVSDPNVRAAWLAGSLGSGRADRYSDIDLHLLLSDVDAFRRAARAWLETLRPLVLEAWDEHCARA